MSSRCHKILVPLLLAAAGAAGAATPALRVCADPDNLPYSQRDESGFENKIARLVASDLGASLSYFWQEQRRGFVRKTMGAGECDLFIGVPAGFDKVLLTKPYYRSTYVAISRADAPPFSGFDTDALRSRRIGVQLIGNDLAASPPGYALTRAGAIDNVTGFTVYGDGPAARRMIEALDAGRIDLALVWGPQAGYFARQAKVPMRVTAATPPAGLPVPFEFSIAMGVRKGDTALRDRLDEILQRRRPEIDAILAQYQVPRADLPAVAANGGRP
jgi:quinoprotein dehydrogenase-associated probable ABC transporter substrate-binding protein